MKILNLNQLKKFAKEQTEQDIRDYVKKHMKKHNKEV